MLIFYGLTPHRNGGAGDIGVENVNFDVVVKVVPFLSFRQNREDRFSAVKTLNDINFGATVESNNAS